jgi:uncharacterized protein (DUF169 family)
VDTEFKQRFIDRWHEHFPGADLPIAFYYTDREGQAEPAPPVKGRRCVICDLAQVRNGRSLRFDVDSVGCTGGKRYLGFTQTLRPNFEYFLSCGIPGELEGERYKKSPELVREYLKHQPPFESPARHIVFKRWDMLAEEDDDPAVVVFFAPADALSGLFTLVNYDEADAYGVIAPFGAGCASIVAYPYRELHSDRPRAVLGMFDVSARPCVPSGVLTFAVPWPKFVRMVDNMGESFLVTGSWSKVQGRIERSAEPCEASHSRGV